MTMFRGAASQWGPGKLHAATWNYRLNRYVPACQRLDPLKGGHDSYDGSSTEVEDPLTCKRCLAKAEKEKWDQVLDAMSDVLGEKYTRYAERWSIESWLRFYLLEHPEVVDPPYDGPEREELAELVIKSHLKRNNRYW